MSRPSVARVDLDALAHNFRAIAAHVARDAPPVPRRVIAVVKANAYGHGAVPVGRALEAAGAAMLACADIDEAIDLRDGGVTCPILVFGALLGLSDLSGIFSHGLTPSVASPTAATALAAAARERGVRIACHLKVDTGMNRMGFRYDNLDRTIPDVAALPNLAIEAVYTHYATADRPDDPGLRLQRDRFESALSRLAAIGVRPAWTHAGNSGAILAGAGTWFGGVRPGLALYGATPPAACGGPVLAPVLSLVSRVAAVKGLRPGDAVGYGGRFRAGSPGTIAVVPLGYADGLDRRLEGRGHVLVGGARAPIVGSVCMDMITVDVTGMPVRVGDEVVLIGRQQAEAVTVVEMADTAGTIPYELLCRVGARVERIYNRAAREDRLAPCPHDRAAGPA